jgi:competence protein ComEC
LNDGSLVLGLACGARHLLLTGDSEQLAESEWVAAAAPFAGGVLKVAHHGSNTSTSSALLDRLTPRVAVISTGWRNRFGFPHESALHRLRSAATAVYRTDRDGAVTVVFGRRVTVRGERWTSGER